MSSGINHDTSAKLLGISPKELTQLVDEGIIARSGRDNYTLAIIVRDYINHLKNPSKIYNQLQIAEHLDMSDRNVREVLEKLSINHKATPIDDIRIAYIRHLREQAAGRSGTGDLDLVTERAALAKEQRIRIEMQNAVTRKEFGPIEALELGLADCLSKIAAQLDTIPGKLKRSSNNLTADDLNNVASTIAEVRNALASMDINWFGDKTEDNDDTTLDQPSESSH